MRALVNRLDVVYEARFRRTSLEFATAPGLVLKSLHRALSSRWTVASENVILNSSQRLSEVRLKVTLFSGQGTFEIDADKIGAHFRNVRAKDDVPIVADCLKLGFDAIGEALKADGLTEHLVKGMMFLKLLDDPKDNRAFLQALVESSAIDNIPTGIHEPQLIVYPTVKFELDDRENGWLFLFDLSRAYRSSEEVFLSATMSFNDDTTVTTMEGRIECLEKVYKACLSSLGVELLIDQGAQ